MMNGTALTIEADNVTVSGFTLKNAAIPSPTAGIGIMLENAHNCSVTNNIVTDNYVGILLVNSNYNVFRSNEISGNIHNLILQNSEPNSIDTSNIVDGKPYSLGNELCRGREFLLKNEISIRKSNQKRKQPVR